SPGRSVPEERPAAMTRIQVRLGVLTALLVGCGLPLPSCTSGMSDGVTSRTSLSGNAIGIASPEFCAARFACHDFTSDRAARWAEHRCRSATPYRLATT